MFNRGMKVPTCLSSSGRGIFHVNEILVKWAIRHKPAVLIRLLQAQAIFLNGGNAQIQSGTTGNSHR